MEVLKTTSPVVFPLAPIEIPRKTLPSSKASTAGTVNRLSPSPARRRNRGAHVQSGRSSSSELRPALTDYPIGNGADFTNSIPHCPRLVRARKTLARSRELRVLNCNFHPYFIDISNYIFHGI